MSDYIERTKKLIERYTELRKEYMSQRALEKETGVTRQVIGQYEKGEVCPTVKALNRSVRRYRLAHKHLPGVRYAHHH